jgi:sugar lactone lactonase YvrE
MSREINTIVTGMSYMEGPRWHAQRIWFSDFYTFRVYSAAEDGSDIRIEAEVPGQPSGLGWLPDGRLLIVSMRDGRLPGMSRGPVGLHQRSPQRHGGRLPRQGFHR